MIEKPVEQGKCSGVAFSTDGRPEQVFEGDYSGRFSGSVDETGIILRLSSCSELTESGKCGTDGVVCPVARAVRGY